MGLLFVDFVGAVVTLVESVDFFSWADFCALVAPLNDEAEDRDPDRVSPRELGPLEAVVDPVRLEGVRAPLDD